MDEFLLKNEYQQSYSQSHTQSLLVIVAAESAIDDQNGPCQPAAIPRVSGPPRTAQCSGYSVPYERTRTEPTGRRPGARCHRQPDAQAKASHDYYLASYNLHLTYYACARTFNTPPPTNETILYRFSGTSCGALKRAWQFNWHSSEP